MFCVMICRASRSAIRSIRGQLAVAVWILAASLFGQEAAPPITDAAPVASTSAPAKPIEFDVAVFRLNTSGQPTPRIAIPPGGDGFTAQNRTMHDLIGYAFAHTPGASYRISGEPVWVDADRYDIQAKVASEDLAAWQKLDQAGQRIALQNFLIEYLKLKFHQDTSSYPYYTLGVGKGGPKMKEYKPGVTLQGPDGQIITGTGLCHWWPGNLAIGQPCTMQRLANLLSGHADLPIVDKTGLSGDYIFVLQFETAPDPRLNGHETAVVALPHETATPLIFSAVKQLGLELKPAKGPMDGMIVDHIERPPQN
jgi:uncharacterized protein (TIGR03435 family)